MSKYDFNEIDCRDRADEQAVSLLYNIRWLLVNISETLDKIAEKLGVEIEDDED